MSDPPYPPFPPFPPYAPYPPYPPYPSYIVRPADTGSVGWAAPPPAGYVAPAGTAPVTAVTPTPETPTTSTPATPFPGSSASNPLSIFFNKDEYRIVDGTNEGLGTGQLAKLAQFVTDARRVAAKAIAVDGFVSPEGVPAMNQILAQNRALAVAARLRALTPMMPSLNISVRTTSVLAGNQASWPSLRRADIYITSTGIRDPRAIGEFPGGLVGGFRL